jgi:hypothetical protein
VGVSYVMDLMLWKGTLYQRIDESQREIDMILVFRCQKPIVGAKLEILITIGIHHHLTSREH